MIYTTIFLFMDYSQIFIDPYNHCVRVDWKTETADTLFCLQEKWGEKYPVLQSAEFLSLEENYSAETAEDHIPAFGQELTLHDLALYNNIEDSDSFCLVIIPQDDTSAFEKCAKSKKVKVILQKQRRKIGDPAKRINLAQRLPYTQYGLVHGWFQMQPTEVLYAKKYSLQNLQRLCLTLRR